MKWEFSPVGVLSMLDDYRNNKYPDDGPRWRLHYSADPSRDAYTLVVQYKVYPRIGDLYAKRSIDGMAVWYFEQADNVAGWIKFITEDFDKARMEIIECLDEQITNQRILEAPIIKKQPQYIKDNYEWKQWYVPMPKLTDGVA